jgi:murein L,D-transpeptidase YafK
MTRILIAATVLIAGAAAAAIYTQYGEGSALQAAHGDLPRKLEGKELAGRQPAAIGTLNEDAQLVLWMGPSGDWRLLAIDPACQLPGELAPRLKSGMNQAPAGFQQASLRQLDPDGRWHVSFNLKSSSAGNSANTQSGSVLTVFGGRMTASCDAIGEAAGEKRAGVTLDQDRRSVTIYVVPAQAAAGNPDVDAAARLENTQPSLKPGCDGSEKEREVPRQAGPVES